MYNKRFGTIHSVASNFSLAVLSKSLGLLFVQYFSPREWSVDFLVDGDACQSNEIEDDKSQPDAREADPGWKEPQCPEASHSRHEGAQRELQE